MEASNAKKRQGRGAGGEKRGKKQAQPQLAKRKRPVDEKLKLYARGDPTISKRVPFKKLRKTLEATQAEIEEAAESAIKAEILLPTQAGYLEAEGNERTYHFRQSEIKKNVDLNTAQQIYDLHLTQLGPYVIDYSRNGRFFLLGGRKGHVAVVDAMRQDVGVEMHLNETVRDVKFLHNQTMFAVAQKKYVYIYDHHGTEIHCMRRHERPYRLEFLPYHFLLVTVGHSGYVKWHDVSTGEFVAGHPTRQGPCYVLRQNPYNAVVACGHSNGVVTMWSPAAGKPLANIFTHKAPVADVAFDREGRYMATAGFDAQMKVWDVRMFRCVHTYKVDRPAGSLDISDRGLLAMSLGREVQILRDWYSRPVDVMYMRHEVQPAPPQYRTSTKPYTLNDVAVARVRFRPFEDVLGIGHSEGFSSIVVPGAGEPNFDSFEVNPFQTPRQRQEAEVQQLLNKLQPDMIGLDPTFVGSLDKDSQTLQKEHDELMAKANSNDTKKKKEKKKMRGRNKISAKLKRRQKNVIDEQSQKLKEKLQQQREAKAQAREEDRQRKAMEEAPAALARFFK